MKGCKEKLKKNKIIEERNSFSEKNEIVKVGKIKFSNDLPFVFIGGPCQIESEKHALMVCDFLYNLCTKLKIPYVFKASFDKSNRTSIFSKRGIGLKKSIPIFEKIKKEFNCTITTDVHLPDQCKEIATVVDILQIPAFLCRQTDLLESAAKTNKTINVKKGQFLSPNEIFKIVEKIEYFNNKNIILTERGTTFGYNNLVVDMRGLDVMAKTRKPIVIDATHAVQSPGGLGTSTGGDRMMAPIIARASIASRPIAGVFCEVHNDPDKAFSDGPNSLNFDMIDKLLRQLKELDLVCKKFK